MTLRLKTKEWPKRQTKETESVRCIHVYFGTENTLKGPMANKAPHFTRRNSRLTTARYHTRADPVMSTDRHRAQHIRGFATLSLRKLPMSQSGLLPCPPHSREAKARLAQNTSTQAHKHIGA